MRQLFAWIWAGCLVLALYQAGLAHAALRRSEPPANATLAQAPGELRLWFSEPVEPQFSEITLRDATGAPVDIPTAQVDQADPYQLFVQPGALPEGTYTVIWSVVSAADGHHTKGSFPFSIGQALSSQAVPIADSPSIPWPDALVRWFNLVSLAWAVGSLGFAVFVGQLLTEPLDPLINRRVQRVIWIGWWLLGISALLVLVMQTATVRDESWLAALQPVALSQVLGVTRFGLLWLYRLVLWLAIGIFLRYGAQKIAWRGVALLLACAILALHSLYSHAAAAQVMVIAVLNDWLHLVVASLWLGGLVQFLAVLGAARQTTQPMIPLADRLTGSFSNYARLCVIALIITGAYSAWLQVGSLAGLRSTLYGQQLLIKLILFLPLLLIAGVNLLLTHRRLAAGQAIWVGRLRQLISAEIGLLLGIFLLVGVMTAITPARNELAEKAQAAAQAVPPAPAPLFGMLMEETNDLHIQITISPGWVGENTFSVALSKLSDNQPITDASLIRLRFEHQSEDLGRSELRITSGQDGLYTVQGANLSAPGDWHIRMTIQRPDQFDVVMDFTPQVPLPPPPPPPPLLDTSLPRQEHFMVLLAAGLAAQVLGAYFVGHYGLRGRSQVGLLAAALALLGSSFLVMAALL